PMIEPELSAEFQRLLSWADEEKEMTVRANADDPVDARKAFEYGASGIGLCRTEHMFMDTARIPAVLKMILADNAAERKAALKELLRMQQPDVEGGYEAMKGQAGTVSVLDLPSHECWT